VAGVAVVLPELLFLDERLFEDSVSVLHTADRVARFQLKPSD
jgi:hypothetical protein